MTAYGLLAALKKTGINSAPIIYRALAALTSSGAVHPIKALGAFVACNCAASHRHALSVLTVCSGCDTVTELHDQGIITQLERLRLRGVALQDHAVIELPITCTSCAA